ncbi:MAG: M48 family peptidase, partial [Gammaproteobacteria bacterium]
MSYKIMPKLLITLISGCISLFLAIVSSSLPAVADDLLLPELGSASGGIMTPTQERRLGQAFMRSVKASQKIIDEAFARTYIEQLGDKLSRATDKDPLSDFDFFIIDNPQINAFAGPGGHIGVY